MTARTKNKEEMVTHKQSTAQQTSHQEPPTGDRQPSGGCSGTASDNHNHSTTACESYNTSNKPGWLETRSRPQSPVSISSLSSTSAIHRPVSSCKRRLFASSSGPRHWSTSPISTMSPQSLHNGWQTLRVRHHARTRSFFFQAENPKAMGLGWGHSPAAIGARDAIIVPVTRGQSWTMLKRMPCRCQ